MSQDPIRYAATPTGQLFHADREAFFRGVMGPIGSGKSVMCCWEIFKVAQEQRPVNGVRRSRWAVARNTYPELKTTTAARSAEAPNSKHQIPNKSKISNLKSQI